MRQRGPGRSAQIARWVLRGFMILAIVMIAVRRGSTSMELVAVALAILWALSLPVILTWSWRLTQGRPGWQRAAVSVCVAALLLIAFALGARALLPG